MTAPPGDLVAYHLGFVVRDLDAVAERYQRVLGIDRWRKHELATMRVPWDAGSTYARLKVAFGRAAGQTFELIQVLEGRTPHRDFLEQHGEGIQHIGLWTANVREAVEHAVAAGGRVTLARTDAAGNLEVQLTPGSPMSEIVGSLESARLAYVDPGIGGVQLEFVGPAGGAGLREWMQQDFDRIILPAPPWEQSQAAATQARPANGV